MHDPDSDAAAARLPIIEPGRGDKRWKHPAWTSNAVLDAIKQAYLMTCRSLLESVDAAEGLDPAMRARMRFFARQFCDAMSPTNFAFLNPAVVEETARSGGLNLLRGTQHLLEDALHNGGRPALVDKAAFAVGKNLAVTRGSVVYRSDLIELIQYAPTTPEVYARPLLIVPPWINKYYVLDLQPHNSFIKYAIDHGIATFVISWRNPDASLAHLRFEDYLFSGSLAAGEVVREITGAPEINQLGYCLGGTLTSMQLAYLAKTDPTIVNAVTSLASLTDFSEAGEIGALLASDTVDVVEADMDEHGVFEAEKMTAAFTLLRSNDLIWNVAIDRYLLGKPAPAFDLLFWNEDATAMPAAMHSYYLRNMYLENRFAKGELTMRGVPIELDAIENDVYLLASIEDHIAPWQSVYKMTELFGGDVCFRLGHSGHIAGIVNPPGSAKGRYWSNDRAPAVAADWFAGANEHEGSWWPDWLAWLTARSGEKKPAVAEAGSKTYPVLDAAPGTYVFG